MTKRTNDPAGTRARIVDVAFEAFGRDGYGAATTLELRERAGVSAGAFAHHFPSKRALGLAAIRQRVAQAVEDAWIDPVVRAPTAPAGVAAALDAVLGELERADLIFGCPLSNLTLELSAQDNEMRAELSGIFDRWRSALAGKVRVDVSAGRAAGVDAEGLATFAVAAISGALTLAKASQSTEPLRLCRDKLAFLFDAAYGPARDARAVKRTGRTDPKDRLG